MSNLNNLRPFQKGSNWQGNPGGRPKIPDALRGIASLTQTEVTKLISKYARMTQEELKEALANPKSPALDLAIISVFAQSIKRGDFSRLSFLLDRAIGKVPQVMLDEECDEEMQELRKLTLNEVIKLVQEDQQ